MGQPTLLAAGIGSLSYGKVYVEPSWGGVYTSLTGAATIASGTSTLTVLSLGQAAVGMNIIFKDANMPTNNLSVLNLLEPPLSITAINTGTNTLTLSGPTTQTHYGVQASGIQTSGSQVVLYWPTNKGFYYQSETLNSTDNPQSTQLMTGSRVGRQNLMLGQEDVMGNVVSPFGPGWFGEFIGAAFGYETETYAASATGSSTSAAATAIGATTITTTGTFSVGNIIQIDSTPNREVRKVLTVTGTSPATLTLGHTAGGSVPEPLRFAHASGATIKTVPTALYTHYLAMANVLPSLTIEKFIAGDAQFGGTVGTAFPISFLYTGAYVNKMSFKASNKAWPEVTCDMMAQGETTIPATVSGAFPTSSPYMFGDLSVSLDTNAAVNFADFELTVDNKLAKDYFFNNSRKVGIIRPGPRMVEGKITYYFKDYTQYESFKNRVSHNISLTWLQANTGYSANLTLPNVYYTSWTEKAPFGGLITVDSNFVAVQDPTLLTEGYMTLTDGTYLPYTF